MLLLFLGSLHAAEVVPGPNELDAAADLLEVRLAEADVSLTAIARVHNALAEATPDARRAACDQEVWVRLAPRTRALGALHRDRAQAARAQGARLEALARSPSLTALADILLAERLGALTERVRRHEAAARELRAWQAAHVTSWLGACKVPLVVAPGLDPTPAGAVAVVGTGGWLCPMGVADGRAAVAPGGLACVAAEPSCGCEPVRHAPGAVVGPG